MRCKEATARISTIGYSTGTRGEALYMLGTGFVAITVNGLASCFLKHPLLFPSLSPTVFALFRKPLSTDSTPRNTIIVHFVALCVGLAMLYVSGLKGEPSVVQEGAAFSRV